jgi:hypothetical protein
MDFALGVGTLTDNPRAKGAVAHAVAGCHTIGPRRPPSVQARAPHSRAVTVDGHRSGQWGPAKWSRGPGAGRPLGRVRYTRKHIETHTRYRTAVCVCAREES